MLLLAPHDEREQRVSGGDSHVLIAVELVGDRSIGDAGPEACVPQRLPCCRVQGDEVLLVVAGEQEIAGGGEQAGTGGALPFVRPTNVAGLVVDGLNA